MNSSTSCFDGIFVTESWLREDVASDHFFDNKLYKVFRQDRINPAKKRGGGTLCAMSVRHSSSELKIPDNIKNCIEMEIIGVNFRYDSTTIKLFVLYIPPDISRSGNDIVTKFFTHLGEFLLSLKGPILIVGDFNLPKFNLQGSTPNRTNITIVKDFLSITGLSQYNEVTRCDNKCLDLVLSNTPCTVIKSPEELVLSDKYPPPPPSPC